MCRTPAITAQISIRKCLSFFPPSQSLQVEREEKKRCEKSKKSESWSWETFVKRLGVVERAFRLFLCPPQTIVWEQAMSLTDTDVGRRDEK
ncbi:hypothetical protein TNIN_60781 [Trichonephila inaurata madagascariensis]|uniref:Uncharacterized protein n=1 Tax=Trichonephila inaurata madagascariensis TaxID=2747483 RepID=A0A8X6XXS7_9ARAC|nr:hypothetical protein TNIN_60781 [Trichonephila inaurata madagascariensis]